MTEAGDADRLGRMIERDDRAPPGDTQLAEPGEIAGQGLEAGVSSMRIGRDRLKATTKVGAYLGWQSLQHLHSVAFEHKRIHGKIMCIMQWSSMHRMH